jgi:hypothetical protein
MYMYICGGAESEGKPAFAGQGSCVRNSGLVGLTFQLSQRWRRQFSTKACPASWTGDGEQGQRTIRAADHSGYMPSNGVWMPIRRNIDGLMRFLEAWRRILRLGFPP